MPVHLAPGLTADWLNAWLAAIGITVVVPEARLAWSNDPLPHALIHHPGDDLPARLFEALPKVEDLQRSPIARSLPGYPQLPRNVSLDAYRARASLARSIPLDLLSSTLTDLIADADLEKLPHSPFDVPAPRGVTLWERAVSCREAITAREAVAATLAGRSQRVGLNGLGFDVRRLPTQAENTGTYVDPTIELLAFYGLVLFPIRGDGKRERTRGWTGPPSRRGSFTWGTWGEPLDRWAIDAWLDKLHANERSACKAVYATVPYQPSASADVTRAYASERLT